MANTGLIIIIVVIVLLSLVGVGILIWWLATRKKDPDTSDGGGDGGGGGGGTGTINFDQPVSFLISGNPIRGLTAAPLGNDLMYIESPNNPNPYVVCSIFSWKYDVNTKTLVATGRPEDKKYARTDISPGINGELYLGPIDPNGNLTNWDFISSGTNKGKFCLTKEPDLCMWYDESISDSVAVLGIAGEKSPIPPYKVYDEKGFIFEVSTPLTPTTTPSCKI